MICEAEKKAACFVRSTIGDSSDSGFAVSIRLPYDRIAKIVDLRVPLRRPRRTVPMPMLAHELSAWDAASDEAWESIDSQTE